jgi:pyruvate kinase
MTATSQEPFAFADTQTKLLWSVSFASLATSNQDTLAERFLTYQLNAARLTYTKSSSELVRSFRKKLVLKAASVTTVSDPEGWCPFVMSHVGRRATLLVPNSTLDVAAGDLLSVLIHTDVSLAIGEKKSSVSQLEICVTSNDMLEKLAVGSALSVSYLQTEFMIEHMERSSKGLLAKVKVTEAATLLSDMDVHSNDMSRDLFPLIAEDVEAFQNRFDGLADYVLVSGVQNAEEILNIRRALFGDAVKGSKRHPSVTLQSNLKERAANVPPKLLIKIDSKKNLDLLKDVFDLIDGVVLSRSELGLTMDPAQLPLIQKQVLASCNQLGKVVIVASELMYSMRVNPNPTRAEVSDMANAAADGADALYLAEEVTEGPHADLVAQVSKETLSNSEILSETNWHRVPFEIANDDDAVAYGALQVAEYADVRNIVCLTEGGYTAVRLSSLRTPAQITAITYNHQVMRQLGLLRSVKVLTLDSAPAFDQVLEETKKALVRQCGFHRGDRFVYVSLTASSISARNSNIFTLQDIG